MKRLKKGDKVRLNTNKKGHDLKHLIGICEDEGFDYTSITFEIHDIDSRMVCLLIYGTPLQGKSCWNSLGDTYENWWIDHGNLLPAIIKNKVGGKILDQ